MWYVTVYKKPHSGAYLAVTEESFANPFVPLRISGHDFEFTKHDRSKTLAEDKAREYASKHKLIPLDFKN